MTVLVGFGVLGVGAPSRAEAPAILDFGGNDPSQWSWTPDPETGTLTLGSVDLSWEPSPTAWRVDLRFAPVDLTPEAWPWSVPLVRPLMAPSLGNTNRLVVSCVQGLTPGTRYVIRARAIAPDGAPGPLTDPVILQAPGEEVFFTETIPLGDLELWTWGRRVTEPEATIRYVSGTLVVNGFYRGAAYNRTPAMDHLVTRYGQSPRFLELRDGGMAPEPAAQQLHYEHEVLVREAGSRVQGPDLAKAIEFLEASSLVDSAAVLEGITVEIRFAGTEELRIYSLGAHTVEPCVMPGFPAVHPDFARGAVSWIAKHAQASGGPRIALLAGEGLMLLRSETDRADFRTQVQFLREHRTTWGLPSGPLSEASALELLDVGF